MTVTRRRFLASSAAATALGLSSCSANPPPEDGWEKGFLRHLIPVVSHRSLHIKASFAVPLAETPWLRVGDRRVPGTRMDSGGRFWAFRMGELASATEYTLQLLTASGEALCATWPLRTFPANDASPESLRVLSFTCAGGISLPIPPSIIDPFRPPAYRRRLFDLALETGPDLVIANGDHVYFDLSRMRQVQNHFLQSLVTRAMRNVAYRFDAQAPVFGHANEESLIGVGDDQVAQIYGVRFRSTPVFFITDDHDYFENDDATPELVTFPPPAFHRALRDGLQRLFFPEFPADDPLPRGIPGLHVEQGLPISRTFGEVRYGDLFNGMLFDCGGHLSLNGRQAGLVPPSVERWLIARARQEDTLHHLHLPSHPMGWTAGKWREWYRDYLDHSGSLVRSVQADEHGNKYQWQEGWWLQHQRLVQALCAQRTRTPLTVSGDLHALGAVRIERSGELALAGNPLYSVLSGPIGTGAVGWPSRARGVSPRAPQDLQVQTLLELEERNGFTLLDFDRNGCRVATWRCPEGYVSPAELTLERALDTVIPRPHPSQA